MCMGAPSVPKMPEQPDPAPSPTSNPPPPPAAPPPELVNADSEAPKVTAQKSARGQAQQAAKGTSQLTIKKPAVNTGKASSGGGGSKKGGSSLNIPT